jgi:hypothetical protein
MRRIGKQVQVGFREARRLQARRDALGRQRAAAGRQRGIGFDQLFVQGAELRFGRIGSVSALHACQHGGYCTQHKTRLHGLSFKLN